MDDNHLDALIYPTIRQKPIFVPATNQPGSNCRVSAQSGLPAISAPVGFTPDGLPVGMEFLGHEFTEGDLLEIAFSWEQATHHRRVPASTPPIDPHWSYKVTDGVATFLLDPVGQQLRFTAPGFETYAYIDPRMESKHDTGKKADRALAVISGEFKDSHWQIRYSVPIGGSNSASIFIDNLWTGGGIYNLYGKAVAQ